MAEYRALTHDEEELLKALWADQDVFLHEIGNRLGISRTNVVKKAKALGLPPRLPAHWLSLEQKAQIRQLVKDGYSLPEIVQRTGKSYTLVRTLASQEAGRQVRLRVPAQAKKWTEGDFETLMSMWDENLPATTNARAIGKALGRKPETVVNKARHLNLAATIAAEQPEVTPDQCKRHAKACLAEGGFPTAHVVNGRAVWVWPLHREP